VRDEKGNEVIYQCGDVPVNSDLFQIWSEHQKTAYMQAVKAKLIQPIKSRYLDFSVEQK
jgi:hypothetical protein